MKGCMACQSWPKRKQSKRRRNMKLTSAPTSSCRTACWSRPRGNCTAILLRHNHCVYTRWTSRYRCRQAWCILARARCVVRQEPTLPALLSLPALKPHNTLQLNQAAVEQTPIFDNLYSISEMRITLHWSKHPPLSTRSEEVRRSEKDPTLEEASLAMLVFQERMHHQVLKVQASWTYHQLTWRAADSKEAVAKDQDKLYMQIDK